MIKIPHPFQQNYQWQKLQDGIAALAKQEILSRFEKVSAERKADGSVLTEADTAMQHKTQQFLQAHWPQYAFVGEEMDDQSQRQAMQSEQGCWVLDPVDGTSNFASGIPFYSVSLALMIEGQVVAGLVYDPSRDEMFSARHGQGAQLNKDPLIATTPKTELKQCSGVIDFKRLSPEMATMIAVDCPYGSQRSFGSVALDWCWIAAGRGQLYLHGSQNIWDYIAGWLILNEAGGYSSTLENDNVLIAKVEKRSAVAATSKELFEKWQRYLGII